MAKLYNLARMTTATMGTGSITLGSAVTGWLTFAEAGVTVGETVTYAIEDGNNREIGRGVYTSGGTVLTRSVLRSTNSNNPINLSGNAHVFITAAKEDVANLGEANTFAIDQTIESTNAGALRGPTLTLDRNSASPAAADGLGQVLYQGRDSLGNAVSYASIVGGIVDPADGSEAGELLVFTSVAGASASRFRFRSGLYAEGATGGDQGAGTVNVTGFYKAGKELLTTGTGAVTGDVTMTNANQFYDGPSASLTAGVWFVVGHITVGRANTTLIRYTTKMWDGTTVYASGQMTQPSQNPHYGTVPLCAIVTLSGTTTVKISAAATTGGCLIKATPADNGTGATNTASLIHAIRVG